MTPDEYALISILALALCCIGIGCWLGRGGL